MDYIRQLGPVALDHRLRRIVDTLLRSAEDVYEARGLPFRGRWTSTYTLLHDSGSLAIGEIATRLRLTHPAVIGIADEMAAADILTAKPDPADARRRLLDLTPRGRSMSKELFDLWKRLGEAQHKRFRAAGCDIMQILEHVEDGLVARPLAAEVLANMKTKRQSRRSVRAAVTVLLAMGMASTFTDRQAGAQQTRPAMSQKAIDAATRAQLVNALSDSLIGGYIYEAAGRRMADSLRAELCRGAYDTLTNGDDLARRINETLRRVSNDRHLGVQYRPSSAEPRASTSPSGEPRRRMVRVPADSAARSAMTGAPRVPQKGISRVIAVPELGIPFAQVLEGNIGYVEIAGFSGNPEALAIIDSVMALFANTRAIIIDVGRNRGGGPPVIQHLSAYLFDKPVHLVSSIMRGMDKPMERWSSADAPGKKLPDIPVYVLTSRLSISAAESFSFGLRNQKRVTIIGERTAGGGHFGDFVSLTPDFTVFLPRGRTYNPATEEGWEAEGLKPDIEVPYDKALDTALSLARNAGGRTRKELEK